MEHQLLQLFDIMLGRVLDGQEVDDSKAIEYHSSDEVDKAPAMDVDPGMKTPEPISGAFVEDDVLEDISFEKERSESDVRSASAYSSEADDGMHSEARKELQHALAMLRQVSSHYTSDHGFLLKTLRIHTFFQVDVILEQLSVFWANTEIVLDMLTKKGLHAEQFIQFAHKPKLYTRFMERVVDYRNFWEGIKAMCQNYLVGNNGPAADTSASSIQINRFSTPPEADMFANQSSTGSLHQKIIDSPF